MSSDAEPKSPASVKEDKECGKEDPVSVPESKESPAKDSPAKTSGDSPLKGDADDVTKGKGTPPPVTPPVTLPLPENIREVKEKFLELEPDVKRSLYRCGENYVTLEDVLDWKNYFAKANVREVKVEEKKYDESEELNAKVSLWQGDITCLEIDSIVNAANASLLGGGGVDGAIHRAAGRGLLRECRELRGCKEGEAKITGGYKLPSKHVIHTVGPQGEKPELLRTCYAQSLDLMLQNNLRSIAFPCVSTGIYGYPRVAAARVALSTVREWLNANSDKVDRVIFTLFLDEDKKVYEHLMQTYFPVSREKAT